MRYQQKIIISRMQVVQENWQLLCTRLSDLEKQQVIETRVEERFRLKQLIKQTQEDKQLAEEELLERPFLDFVHPDDQIRAIHARKASKQTTQEFLAELPD